MRKCNNKLHESLIYFQIKKVPSLLLILLKQKIRWNDNLTIHEDSYFNSLCQKLAKELKYS